MTIDSVYVRAGICWGFLDPSRLVGATMQVITHPGSEHSVALHGAPGSCSVIGCCIVTCILVYLRDHFVVCIGLVL